MQDVLHLVDNSSPFSGRPTHPAASRASGSPVQQSFPIAAASLPTNISRPTRVTTNRNILGTHNISLTSKPSYPPFRHNTRESCQRRSGSKLECHPPCRPNVPFSCLPSSPPSANNHLLRSTMVNNPTRMPQRRRQAARLPKRTPRTPPAL